MLEAYTCQVRPLLGQIVMVLVDNPISLPFAVESNPPLLAHLLRLRISERLCISVSILSILEGNLFFS